MSSLDRSAGLHARIAAVVLVSGFCSLTYQVAWLRLLRLVFGVSTASSAAVVAIFMGGLGLGGYLFGRRVRRARNPLAFYAALELGIAVSAGLTPFLVDGARAAYFAAGGAATLGLGGATLVRLVLATLVLGVSTTLMGGTLPAVAQATVARADRGRRALAALYGWNTLGAVLGAFLTTFFLLELLGIRRSLWLACAVNLLLALWARSLARRWRGAAAAGPAEEAPRLRRLSARARVVLPAAALVGFLFFLMELVWYRMLAPVLGGSSYTFGLILTLALLGIGTGGLLYAAGGRRAPPTLHALAATCALEALCLIVPYALGDHLAVLAAVMRPLGAAGFSGLVAGWVLVAGIVVLPASVVAGYQFPLLVALLGPEGRAVGHEVGLVYAWNTWGAILGSLAGGFGFLPLFGAPRLWWVSALLLVLLAVAAAALALREEGRRRLALPLAVSALVAALAFAGGPSAFWRHLPIGAGRAEIDLRDPNGLRRSIHAARRAVLREAEGVESSVALTTGEDLALVVNGKSDGSSRVDGPTMVMSGLVGALLVSAPERALVIGLGTGTTAGWMARIEEIERVDVVELEPAVAEFARDYRLLNLDVLASPKMRLVYGDGRELVLAGEGVYDVVFSEPSNPYRAGVADLFSRDFYRAVSRRLADGGVFLQWLQGYEIDPSVIQGVYATLASVFPHLETWQVHASDLLLVASNTPIEHDFDRLRARVRAPPYDRALELLWRVDGLEGFYSGFIATGAMARALAAAPTARVSTDDRPTIEFGFARNVGRTGRFRLHELQRLARVFSAFRPAGTGAPPDWARVDELRHLRATLGTAVYDGAVASVPDEATSTRFAAREAYGRGELARAGRLWDEQGAAPVAPLDRLLVAETLAERGDPRAEPWIDRLRRDAPTEAAAIAARYRFRRGEPAAAAAELLAMLELARDDAFYLSATIERALALLEHLVAERLAPAEPFFAALGEPFAIRHLERKRLRLRLAVAERLADPSACVPAFAAYEPHPDWQRAFLDARRRCYRAAGYPLAAAAERDYDAFLEASAPQLDVVAPR